MCIAVNAAGLMDCREHPASQSRLQDVGLSGCEIAQHSVCAISQGGVVGVDVLVRHGQKPHHLAEPAQGEQKAVRMGDRVVRTTRVAERFVAGIPIYIERLDWRSGGVSFDVFDAVTDECLTLQASFDAVPSDAQIVALLTIGG